MDKTVRLWHISRRECLCTFQHIDFVTAIVFHPKVSTAVTCTIVIGNVYILMHRLCDNNCLPSKSTAVALITVSICVHFNL